MPSRINHVALELAPGQAHPFGDREITYDVYLPLKKNGRLDENALVSAGCRVRRRAPGDVRHGKVSIGEGGKLVFAYDNGSTHSCGCEHLLEGAALRAGQRIAIRDDSGDPHSYEVVSIRETDLGLSSDRTTYCS